MIDLERDMVEKSGTRHFSFAWTRRRRVYSFLQGLRVTTVDEVF